MSRPTPVTTRVITAAREAKRKDRSRERETALPPAVRTRLAGTQVKSVLTMTGSAERRRPAKAATAAAKLNPAAPTAVTPTARREKKRMPTSPLTAAPGGGRGGRRRNIDYPLR